MNRDDDAEIRAAAHAGFVGEAAHLLAQFEQALLAMEAAPGGAENLNAAFRAVHAIKAMAGTLEYAALVSFAHEVETLLERLRAGQLAMSDPIAAAPLAGSDPLEVLLGEVRSGEATAEVTTRSAEQGRLLRRIYGGASAQVLPYQRDPTERRASPGAPVAATSTAGAWHLSLRFDPGTRRDGIDPQAWLLKLSQLGDVLNVQTLTEPVLGVEQIDPENGYLGMELRLQSDCDRKTIEGAFEWDCQAASIEMLPPDATPADYEALLGRRCGDDEEARSRLLWIWLSQGVNLRLRDEFEPASSAASDASCDLTEPTFETFNTEAPAAATQPSRPKIERRTETRAHRPTGDESQSTEGHRCVKVHADKLEHLIDLMGQLVIAEAEAQRVVNLQRSPALLEATQRVSELVQATRDGVLALRAAPVG